MRLRGQHGYAMAALLVALSVMACSRRPRCRSGPVDASREREAEPVFRVTSTSARSGLFTAKAGPGVLPPNLDVLIAAGFLRKKDKDPITDAEFDLLSPVQATAPTPGAPAGGGGSPSRSRCAPDSSRPQEAVRLSRRSRRRAGAARRRAASWASRARARHYRFASTTVGTTTTSGSSSTSPRSRSPALGAGTPGPAQGPGQPPGVGGPGRGGPGRQGAPGTPLFGAPGGRLLF